MTVARATYYCTLYFNESAAVCVMTQQHKRKLTQRRRQNNNIAETITHKPIQYNK